MKRLQRISTLIYLATLISFHSTHTTRTPPARNLMADMIGAAGGMVRSMGNAGIQGISSMGFNPHVSDPSLVEESAATNMENNDENDPVGEAMAENEVDPQMEEELDEEMNGEGLDPAVAQYFGDHEHEGEHEGEGHEGEGHEGEEEINPELSSDDDYEHDEAIPEDQIIDHGMIAMDHHNDLEKMQNFKKIADDCKVFLEEFRDCLDNIPDAAWDEEEIQKCIGKDFTRVVNDICNAIIFIPNL